ncbi:helix-turn-helix domain-containing protein, partial [Bacteroidales bacterium OttesenSCG-928-K03]|nr:helix-turn-helix domain-containing protein [Bacteroidales bacterium OttesenSCG-928-K03]
MYISSKQRSMDANTTTQSDIVCKNLAKEIEKLIERKRLYLNPNLSKANIAFMLNKNEADIDSVFSLYVCNDFNYYLNELRITHAAILFINNNSHLYSMERIGKESGFESYESFNKISEQLTGMSPEEIREYVRLRNSLNGMFRHENAKDEGA